MVTPSWENSMLVLLIQGLGRQERQEGKCMHDFDYRKLKEEERCLVDNRLRMLSVVGDYTQRACYQRAELREEFILRWLVVGKDFREQEESQKSYLNNLLAFAYPKVSIEKINKVGGTAEKLKLFFASECHKKMPLGFKNAIRVYTRKEWGIILFDLVDEFCVDSTNKSAQTYDHVMNNICCWGWTNSSIWTLDKLIKRFGTLDDPERENGATSDYDPVRDDGVRRDHAVEKCNVVERREAIEKAQSEYLTAGAELARRRHNEMLEILRVDIDDEETEYKDCNDYKSTFKLKRELDDARRRYLGLTTGKKY